MSWPLRELALRSVRASFSVVLILNYMAPCGGCHAFAMLLLIHAARIFCHYLRVATDITGLDSAQSLCLVLIIASRRPGSPIEVAP